VLGISGSLAASLVVGGLAVVAALLPLAFSSAYRRLWTQHMKRNWTRILVIEIVLITIASSAAVQEGSQGTFVEHLEWRELVIVLLAPIVIGGLVWLKRHHPDVWAEVGQARGFELSAKGRWALIRWGVVVALLGVIAVGAVVLAVGAPGT
jgi:protein-S-isoprenylcysteine O-methyltransferase Ste14